MLLLPGTIHFAELFLYAGIICLGNTKPASHPTSVISTGVSSVSFWPNTHV